MVRNWALAPIFGLFLFFCADQVPYGSSGFWADTWHLLQFFSSCGDAGLHAAKMVEQTIGPIWAHPRQRCQDMELSGPSSLRLVEPVSRHVFRQSCELVARIDEELGCFLWIQRSKNRKVKNEGKRY